MDDAGIKRTLDKIRVLLESDTTRPDIVQAVGAMDDVWLDELIEMYGRMVKLAGNAAISKTNS